MPQEKDEWGNIQLPGLSDEELFTKNWNVVAAAHERNQNPKTLAKYRAEGQRKKTSAEHKELMRKVNKRTAQTAEWQQAHDQANSVRFQDPAWREWKAEDNRQRMADPAWHVNLMTGMNTRDQTPEFQQHLENLKQSKYKPIHAGEYGDFPSRQAAEEYMTAKGVVNATGKLRDWLNPKHPRNRCREYYYLDK